MVDAEWWRVASIFLMLNLWGVQVIICLSVGISLMGCEDPMPASEFNHMAHLMRLFYDVKKGDVKKLLIAYTVRRACGI